jgi:hypothetical protein
MPLGPGVALHPGLGWRQCTLIEFSGFATYPVPSLFILRGVGRA